MQSRKFSQNLVDTLAVNKFTSEASITIIQVTENNSKLQAAPYCNSLNSINIKTEKPKSKIVLK